MTQRFYIKSGSLAVTAHWLENNFPPTGLAQSVCHDAPTHTYIYSNDRIWHFSVDEGTYRHYVWFSDDAPEEAITLFVLACGEMLRDVKSI